jgi:hypothetical protein
MYLSGNDFKEVKVDSFSYFQPNKTPESSPYVCPSLLQWAEYLLTPAIETENKKIERLQKLGEKTNGALQYDTYHNEIPPTARQDCGGGCCIHTRGIDK